MRVAARPVSASSCFALTLPRAYRSNRPTAIGIGPGRSRGCAAARGRRRKPRPARPPGSSLLVELRGVALGDPLRQPAAVLLGAGGLGDQLVPVVRDRSSGSSGRTSPGRRHSVQPVLEQLERPAQVALPAVGVPGRGAGRSGPPGGPRPSSAIVAERQTVRPLWATWYTRPVSTRPWRSMKRSCCSRWLAGP